MLSTDSITPVILAAGDSTRMGYPKALLPLGNGLFITRILEVLKNVGFPQPVVILGRDAARVTPVIQDWSTIVRINTDPDRGQLSSIQIGLSSINPEARAGMIWPVDQPAVSEKLVGDVVQLFLQARPLIAYPTYRGRRGHPAIFDRAIFHEFMEAPLQEGPKNILLRHQGDSVELPTNEQAAIQDIDTPAEYEALTGEGLQSAIKRTTAEP